LRISEVLASASPPAQTPAYAVAAVATKAKPPAGGEKYNWGFSKELCESLLQHCFPFWRKHFGKKTSSTLQQDEEL